jgi:ferredoxin
MERLTHHVRFVDERFAPVEVPDGACLSEVLHIHNSPVLFGCRTGLCGTCTAVVNGPVPPAGPPEAEVLEWAAPDEPAARLLCQIHVHADLKIGRVIGAA